MSVLPTSVPIATIKPGSINLFIVISIGSMPSSMQSNRAQKHGLSGSTASLLRSVVPNVDDHSSENTIFKDTSRSA